MYKKIKATKNNNLKKASVFTAVAALASLAVVANPEQLFTGGSSSGSAFAFFGGNPWRQPWGMYPQWPGYGYNSVANPTLRSSDSKLSASMFNSMFDWLCQNSTLNISDLQKDLSSTGDWSALGVAGPVLKYLCNDGDPNALFSFSNFLGQAGSGVGSRACSLGQYINSLLKTQLKLYQLLKVCQRLVNLPLMKNPEKLEALKEETKKIGKNYIDVVKMIDLGRINQGGPEANASARSLVERAVSLFFDGKGLSAMNDDTSMYNAVMNALESDSAGASCDLSMLKSVLTVVLQMNIYINRFIRQCAVFRTLLNWSQATRALRDKIARSQDSIADKLAMLTAILDKETFLKMLGDGYTDDRGVKHSGLGLTGLTALLLVGSSASSLGEFSSMLGGLQSVKEHVMSDLAKGRSPANINAAGDAARSAVGFSRGGFTTKVLHDVGSSITALFSKNPSFVYKMIEDGMDKPRSDGFAETLKVSGFNEKATPEEKRQMASVASAFSNNAGGRYKFSFNGVVPKGSFVVGISPSSCASLLAVLLGQPEIVATRAIGTVLVKDFMSAVSDSYWDLGSKGSSPWSDAASFSAPISGIYGEFQKIHKDTEGISETTKKIKTKKTDEKKNDKKKETSPDNSVISQVVSFNGNDTKNNTIVGTPIVSSGSDSNKFVSLRVEGFDSSTSVIAPVLCPKTKKTDSGNKDEKSKSSNKNVDLPDVKVVNGAATIDLSDYTPDTGLYELHIRKRRTDGSLEFLNKFKFFKGAKDIKRTKIVKSTFSQAKDPKVDTDKQDPTIYKNSDGTLTAVFTLKDGFDGSGMFALVFPQGQDANLERDQVGVQISDGKAYVTLSQDHSQINKLQIHFYKDKLDAANYIGKFEADQSNTSDITTSEDKYALSSVLAKPGASTSDTSTSFETQEKVVLLKLPVLRAVAPVAFNYGIASGTQDFTDFYTNREVTIKFLNDKGNVVKTQNVKLDTKVDEESNNSSWDSFNSLFSMGWGLGGKQSMTYRVKLDVPVSDEGYKLRIEELPSAMYGRVSSLDSSDKVSSKTDSEKTITFNTVNKSGGSFWGSVF